MGWLDKLLNDKPGKPEAAPLPSSAQDGDDAPAAAADVDALYYRWLTGARAPSAAPEREQRVLDELTRLAEAPIAGAALVPRLPEIIPRLMRTLADDNMNAAELSRQLSEDVVLVAEVFREANRPAYLPRYHAGPPVSSVEAAIMLLGQNGMRMLLARVAFRPVISMQGGRLAKQLAPIVWRQSEKGALAASLLAPSMRANALDAYLGGLMANVGLVVALRLIDQVCQNDVLPQSDAFVAGLFARTRVLSARIADLWEFPVAVTHAIETAQAPNARPLAQALGLGERLAKLRLLVDGARFGADDPFVVAGLDKTALSCFDKLRDQE